MGKLFNSKKKVIIGIILLCIILIAGSVGGYEYYTQKKHKEYALTFTKTTMEILVQTRNCEQMSSEISTVWSSAIDNERDFNDAISEAHQEFKDNGDEKKVEDSKSKIEKDMIALQNPPKDYKEAHDLLVQLYSKYGELYSQATSPSGSLTSYNNDTDEKESDFNETYDKLSVLKPELKSNKK